LAPDATHKFSDMHVTPNHQSIQYILCPWTSSADPTDNI